MLGRLVVAQRSVLPTQKTNPIDLKVRLKRAVLRGLRIRKSEFAAQRRNLKLFGKTQPTWLLFVKAWNLTTTNDLSKHMLCYQLSKRSALKTLQNGKV